MATAVQIELIVDESGAVQGIRTFDSAVKGSAVDVGKLDATLQKLNEHLDRIGQRAPQMKKIGDHSLSALDNVRLLRDDIGIRIPRAMEKAIASSQVLMGVIKGVGTGLLAVGAIEIGANAFRSAIDGAQKFYSKFLDVNGALKEYEDEARKAAAIKLFDGSGLQEQIAMIADVNRQIDQLAQKKRQSSGFLTSFLMGSGYDYFSPTDQKRLNQLTTQQDQSKLAGIEADYRDKLRQIENAERLEAARAPEYARPRVSRKYDAQRAIQEQNYISRRDTFLTDVYNRGLAPQDQKQIPSDDGYREAQALRENSKAKNDASDLERQRTLNEEMRHLRDQADEAELKGIALLERQREAADVDWVHSHGKSATAIARIDAKFFAEERRMLDEQRRQTEEMQGSAALVGFHGIGHIQAQGDLDIAKINGDPSLDSDTKETRIAAIRMRVNLEMLEQEHQFAEQVDALHDEMVDRQTAGFARIEAARRRTLDQAKLAFDKEYGQTDRSTAAGESAYQSGLANYNRRVGLINGGASLESSELARHNADETAEIEMQARAHQLSAEKQQTQAIQAEYAARLEKWQQQLDKQEISQDDFDRRAIAAARERDAQIVESAKAAREKMGNEFSSFFKSLEHPTEALKDMGDKVAGQAAAALVQRLQNRYGRGAGAAKPGNVMDSLWSHISGVPTNPDRAAEQRTAGGSGFIALSTATIHVGAASVILSASGSSTGSAYGFPGSTGSSLSSGISWSGGSGGSFGGGGGSYAGGSGSGAGGGGISGAIGDLQQGISFAGQARSIFGSKSSTNDLSQLAETQTPDVNGHFDENGNFVTGGAAKNGGMLGGGGVMNNLGGAASGALGLYSAYQGNGGISGTLSGAMSGMELGMAVGGPIGAAVGAIAGGVLGAIGFGGREKARVYWLKNGRPRMKGDTDSYQQGGMDYLSAMQDIESLKAEANRTTNSMGPAAKAYYQDTIKAEITASENNLTREQKAGRSQFTTSIASYEVGTDRVPMTGQYTLHKGESVFTADRTERVTRAMESMSAVAAGYRSTVAQRGYGSGGGGWGGDIHLHTLDAATSHQWIMKNKHVLRAAVNASFGENSGGADA